MNTVRSTSKFVGHKRESNDTEDLSCLRLSKIVRKANNAGSSRTVMDLVDYISLLPDDILVNILSQLTVKEAARTSVLSIRWKHLWRFFSGILHFDSSWITPPHRGSKFVDKVTKVLQSLWSPSLEEFNICFHPDTSTYESSIDSWIEFAMKTKVKRFYMNLKTKRLYHQKGYNFPLQSLDSSMYIFLTAFHLRHVDVTGQIIEHILSKCPLLEDLCVKDSPSLGNVKISGPTLKLKNLELMDNSAGSIEISAINLVSFKYYGVATSLIFKGVPRLSAVSFRKSYPIQLFKKNLSYLSNVASQLKTLALDFSFCFTSDLGIPLCLSPDVYMNYLNFPNFNNIKQMQLTIDDSTILAVLEVFPSLHMLSVQLKMRYRNYVKTKWTRKHQCLRVVEIVGFRGHTCDVELAKHLFEYAILLEKIIIDYSSNPDWILRDEKRLEKARSCAQELERIKPVGAKLVIR